jgi:hypothetical protein
MLLRSEKAASPEVAKAAEGMTKKEAKKFAKTKHKGLPETVKESGYFPTPESQRADEAKYNLRGQSVKSRTVATQAGAKMKPVKEAADCGCDDKGADKEKERDTRGDYAKTNLIKNKLRAMGAKNPIVMVAGYEPDGDQLDELNRLEKEQGKQSGGSSDQAYRMVKKSIRKMEGTPAGQRKKEKGKKPPAAGEYGGPRSPAQKVAMRRADAQRAQDMQRSRFD